MLNRRQFCQKVVWFGGVLALAPFIEGCAEPAPPADTPLPTATSQRVVHNAEIMQISVRCQGAKVE